jgi:hypothetical protein
MDEPIKNTTPITNDQKDISATSPVTTPEATSVDNSVLTSNQNSQPSVNIPVMQSADKKTDEEKLERAKLAMEGPERTAIREEREHSLEVKTKLEIIDAKLSEIAKQKEVLELNWIKFDESRNGLRNMINPIVERETTLEADETQLEEQEKNTVNEHDRITLEQKRWGIQEQRHKAEEEKWIYENRLFKIEDQIKTNTASYQKLLDEEEALFKERDEVEKETI